MLQFFGKNVQITLGNGTVSIEVENALDVPSINMVNCPKTEIGKTPYTKYVSDGIVDIRFLNVESIQVLIDKLEECKELIEQLPKEGLPEHASQAY